MPGLWRAQTCSNLYIGLKWFSGDLWDLRTVIRSSLAGRTFSKTSEYPWPFGPVVLNDIAICGLVLDLYQSHSGKNEQ